MPQLIAVLEEEGGADEHPHEGERNGGKPPFDEIVFGIDEDLHGSLLDADRARPALPACRRRRQITRDTKNAVNTDANRPMSSVTANPLMGPVPNWKRKSAEMIVVMCVSMMVPKAREKPCSIAARTVFPSRSSSRIRSNTRTFESMAMPSVRMMPAMPGSVSVALKYAIIPRRITRLSRSARTALMPAPW